MKITTEKLAALNTALKGTFKQAFEETPSDYEKSRQRFRRRKNRTLTTGSARRSISANGRATASFKT